MIQAIPVSAFSDNYIWLIPIPGESHRVAIVDPGDAEPVFTALRALDCEPSAILITHHHSDHCAGVPELTARYRVPVFGPARSPARSIDHPLGDGEEVALGEHLRLRVIAVPGHTLDHIAYFGADLLFCGDTLFTGGCGRLFEGSPAQMYDSLRRLSVLPDSTRVHCGHEYTIANLKFARQVEPDNALIRERIMRAQRLREHGQPTVPSTLDEERDTNPFLRCKAPAIVTTAEHAAGHRLASEQDVFAVIRHLKDHFRG
jgi:hydroxyacylglutathione hydrolase